MPDNEFDTAYNEVLLQVSEEHARLFDKNPEPGEHWRMFYDKLEETLGLELMTKLLHDIHKKRKAN